MRKRDIILKTFIYALALLVFYLLQAAVFPRLAIGGIKPLVLPVLAAGAALYEGGFTGALVGLFAGLLCDVSMSGGSAVFTILLAAAGAGVGILSELMLTRTLPTLILCSLAVLLLCAFAQAFPFIFYDGVSASAAVRTALFQTLYSLAFTLPVWAVVRPVSARFRKA